MSHNLTLTLARCGYRLFQAPTQMPPEAYIAYIDEAYIAYIAYIDVTLPFCTPSFFFLRSQAPHATHARFVVL